MTRNNTNHFETLINNGDDTDHATRPNQQGFQIDNLRTILVPTLFNGDNFLPWSTSIKRTLIANDKLKFIEGSIEVFKANIQAYHL